MGLHRPISKGRKELGGLVRRHELVRDERVLCLQHLACKEAHHWLCRQVEVAQHLVRAPTTKKTDDVRVNVGNKQSSGARGSEGPS